MELIHGQRQSAVETTAAARGEELTTAARAEKGFFLSFYSFEI